MPGTGFIAFVVLAERFPRFGERLHSFCLFQTLLGIPCPGCRVTRALTAIVDGRLAAAWSLNPSAFAVMLFFIASLAFAVAEVTGRLSRSSAARARIVADRSLAATLLFVWTVSVLMPQFITK